MALNKPSAFLLPFDSSPCLLFIHSKLSVSAWQPPRVEPLSKVQVLFILFYFTCPLLPGAAGMNSGVT